MTKTKLNVAKITLAIVLVVSLACAVGLTAFADETAAVAQTREFNETFDRMLAEAGAAADARPAYRSVNWEAGQCITVTNPVFKIGSAFFEDAASISMEIRSTGENAVTLADLKLGLRMADSDYNATVNAFALTDDDIATGIEFDNGETDITDDWSTMTLTFTGTNLNVIVEKDPPEEGEDPHEAVSYAEANVPLLAIHLYAANSAKAGNLEIRNIKVNGSTVVEDFDTTHNNWWKDSQAGTYVDYPTTNVITSELEIKSTDAKANNVDEKYSAIVLNIAGNGNVTVAPIDETGTVGAAKAWTELTDLDGTALAALDGTYRNAVISLESLGMTKIQGVKIAVSGEGAEAYVKQAFFTNMDSREPDEYFPVLDVESIAYMTQFNFEYLNANSDYNAASAACAAFNLNYIMSYNNPSVITNGHLVLDANGKEFTDMKINSKIASEGRRYLVIKYALVNGATLNDFRFTYVLSSTGDVVNGVLPTYANQLKAGFELPSLSEANPYQADGNYEYLVVDMQETFGVIEITGLNMYFSGAGQLLIDEIFYADAVAPEMEWTDNSLENALTIAKTDAGSDGYAYIDNFYNDKATGNQFMAVEVEGDITNLRFQFAEPDKGYYWFSENTNMFKDVNGNTFDLTDTSARTLIVDLTQSGITGEIGRIHMHYSFAEDAEDTDTITITSVKFGSYVPEEIEFGDNILAESLSKTKADAEADGHVWVGGTGTNGQSGQFMELVVEGDITNLRLVLDDPSQGTYWFVNNPEGSFKDVNGNLLDITGTTHTLLIDLSQTGIKEAIGWIHFHNNFAEDAEDTATITIKSVRFGSYPLPEFPELPTNDDSKPEITSSIAATGTVGTEITLSASATDNYSDNVTISYTVTFGTTNIALTNNKFTPTEAGTYSVEISADDGNGNVAKKTTSIVVSAAQTTDPTTPDPTEPTKLSTGAIVGIVLGCVAVVCGVVVAVIFIRKKKNG